MITSFDNTEVFVSSGRASSVKVQRDGDVRRSSPASRKDAVTQSCIATTVELDNNSFSRSWPGVRLGTVLTADSRLQPLRPSDRMHRAHRDAGILVPAFLVSSTLTAAYVV